MVPAGSDRVSRARPYSGGDEGGRRAFAYGALTLCSQPFQAVRLTDAFVTPRPRCGTVKSLLQPRIELSPQAMAPDRFGLIPFRSPLLRESRFLSFPPATEMCQFAGLPSTCPMCSGRDTRALPRVGSPIRKSAGQRLFSASPRLIAAVHVLHRLLAPRHPPRALNILTDRAHLLPLCSFQGTGRPAHLPARS